MHCSLEVVEDPKSNQGLTKCGKGMHAVAKLLWWLTCYLLVAKLHCLGFLWRHDINRAIVKTGDNLYSRSRNGVKLNVLLFIFDFNFNF